MTGAAAPYAGGMSPRFVHGLPPTDHDAIATARLLWDVPERGVIRVAGFEPESVVDGPGVRAVLFVQGCWHACPGCHNPQTWTTDGGTDATPRDIFDRITEDPLVKGVTFSGGDPYLQWRDLIPLALCLRVRGIGLWIYTGCTWDEIAHNPLTPYADVVVDGPFVQAKKTLLLPFRGSSNQRLIDVRATFEAGHVVTWAA